ncbi:MAG: purine-nucleoside phosphorylase [Ruminococcaceae bacterium]|nr:purine-nucleoside phosphorylase [Oscillospiraceae bacterium]
MSVPTPHNVARPGDFAKTVLMPGDPKRSQFIAENFLESPRLVNDVRGVRGYTGYWKGAPVSVMASGMGIPSIGIYSWELFSEYGVENILRVGSAGALQEDLHVRDIVLGLGACTDSNYAHHFGLPGTFAPVADYTLLRAAAACAEASGKAVRVGNLLSSDNFYNAGADSHDGWKQMGVLAVEMEAAGLYMNAARLGKRALAICTISDHIYLPENLSAEARQSSFREMMELALDTAAYMDGV